MKQVIDIQAGKYKAGDSVVDNQPGANTNTRKLIPGYSQIVYVDLVSGNDGNTGLTEAQAKATVAGAAAILTVAGKIQFVSANPVLSSSTPYPIEMKPGLTGTIQGTAGSFVSSFSNSGTVPFALTDNIAHAIWCPKFQLFFAGTYQGGIASSPDGSVFTTITPPTYISPVQSIWWSSYYERIYVGTQDGHIYYTETSDGSSWTLTPYPLAYNASGLIPAIRFFAEDQNGVVVACGAVTAQGVMVYRAADGVTFEAFVVSTTSQNNGAVAYSPSLGKWLLVGANFWLSDDAKVWRQVTLPGGFTGLSYTYTAWSESLSLFVATRDWGGSAQIATSSDGLTWAQTTVGAGSGFPGVYAIVGCVFDEATELFMIGVANASSSIGKIGYSADGVNWSISGSMSTGTDSLRYFAFSPDLFMAIGVTDNKKIRYSNATYDVTITKPISGFNIVNCGFSSGPIDIYSCTLDYALRANTILNFYSSDIKRAYVKANKMVCSESMVSNLTLKCTVAASKDVKLHMNTVRQGGKVWIDNASETLYEDIVDNLIEGDIKATYGVLVTSGNTRGNPENVYFDIECTFDDPLFVDTVNYNLQREIDGYSYDSNAVAASLVFLNSAGVARDIGAWSFTETNVEYKYRRHFSILKPSAKDSIKFQRHLVTSMNSTTNGTPSVVNIPEAASEDIYLTYGSLNAEQKGNLKNQFEFIEYMWTQESMDVLISWDGDDALISEITLDGAASAGDVFINVLETDVEPGRKFTWDGTVYTVLRVSGTRLLLDKDIISAIPDTTVVPLKSPVGYGEYKFIPEKDPMLSLNHFAQTDYKRGMTLRFGRKCV